MAYEAGTTRQELIEFLNVAITEGGCPAEQWALKAYQVFKDLQPGTPVEEEICCKS
jgi:alkylhydroperoxidase/carboxymuconolactone decarboxylase family protein YurZ